MAKKFMKNNHQKKFTIILDKEVLNITSNLPFFQKTWTSFLRSKMKWDISYSFKKHNTFVIFQNSEKSLEASIVFACFLYRRGAIFDSLHHLLLANINSPNFISTLKKYGDTFTSVMLREVMENILDYQEIERTLQHTTGFYISQRFSRFYQSIFANSTIKKEQKSLVDTYLASSFDALMLNKRVTDSYLELLEKHADSEVLLPLLKFIYSVTQNIGTSKSYEIVLKFCERFTPLSEYIPMIDVATNVSEYKKPEVFEFAFSWSCKTQWNLNNIARAFNHGNQLLGHEKSSFALFSFDRFIKYISEKEDRLSNMSEENIEYYFQKAVEFFVS